MSLRRCACGTVLLDQTKAGPSQCEKCRPDGRAKRDADWLEASMREPRPKLTCAVCEEPIKWTERSLPQGQAMCVECRRERMLKCVGCSRTMKRQARSAVDGEAMCLNCRRIRQAERMKR